MTFKHVLGIDLGNGWVKGRSMDKSVLLPSMVAKGDQVGKGLKGGTINLKTYNSHLAKGIEYVWGKEIKRVHGAVSTYSQQDRYEQLEYQILAQMTMLELLGNGVLFEDVLVVTGVPSIEMGTAVEEKLKKVFMSSHVVNNTVIKVTHVEVVPQPLGTVLSLALDDEGFTLNDKYETSKVAVLDIGTGTTDLDVIDSLMRQNETTSVDYGMHDVYSKIAEYVNMSNTNAKATASKAEETFSESVYKISERSKVDTSTIKPLAISDTFTQIKAGINATWKSLDVFDEIIVTGGGASVFKKHLKEYLKDYTIPKNSQLCNADGFYKYGMYLKGIEEDEQALSTTV